MVKNEIKITDKPVIDNVSQSEKNRINYIIPVVEFLFTDNDLNIIEIEKKLKFSRDSIKKTMLLLIKRGLIRERKEKRLKRKHYEIKSHDELRKYLENLKRLKLKKS